MDFNAVCEEGKFWGLDDEGLLEQLKVFQEQLKAMDETIRRTRIHLEQASEVVLECGLCSDRLREQAEDELCLFYRLAGEFEVYVARSLGMEAQASSSSSTNSSE